jgi:hypothetical protein
MTHGPINTKYVSKLRIAYLLDEYFNGGLQGEDRLTGFAILIFPFGEDPKGRINYISNAKREDIIVAMKELLARFQGFDPKCLE